MSFDLACLGNILEAVRHARLVFGEINKLKGMNDDEVFYYAKTIGSPLPLVQLTKKLGRLPVVTFAAGRIEYAQQILTRPNST